MTFQPRLSEEQIRELLVDHEDGWKINELSVIYKVSIRTVYRILAAHDRPLANRKKRRRRVKQKPKVVKELMPCGTNAAYQRHRRKGEYPCSPCLEAHAENVKAAKEKRK